MKLKLSFPFFSSLYVVSDRIRPSNVQIKHIVKKCLFKKLLQHYVTMSSSPESYPPSEAVHHHQMVPENGSGEPLVKELLPRNLALHVPCRL